MKKLLPLISLILLAKVSFATEGAPNPERLKAEKAVHDFVGDCPGEMTFTHKELTQKLPAGFKGERVEVKSETSYCGGSYAYITAPSGDYYVGNPWPLDSFTGTPEQKLRQFTTAKLQEAFDPMIYRAEKKNGLYRVELYQTTESGRIPLSGFIDPEGTVFFMGPFRSSSKSAAEQRIAQVAPAAALAPSRGKANAKVTLYEFSDFECPSCRNAAGFMKPILAKYGDDVRYVRIDLPLVNAHPWAFNAAVMGRAIFKQSPAAFWEYKEQVYSNQDKLNAFTLEDFVKGFVADHDLDTKRFEKDIASPELKKEITDSLATAYSIPVLATPTFMVNGEIVGAGKEGEHLDAALAKALGK